MICRVESITFFILVALRMPPHIMHPINRLLKFIKACPVFRMPLSPLVRSNLVTLQAVSHLSQLATHVL